MSAVLLSDAVVDPADAEVPAGLHECFDCGRLHRLRVLPQGAVARCTRCNQVLVEHGADPAGRPLALVLAGLVLMLIAASQPFMAIDVFGRASAIRLASGPVQLEDHGMWELAILVVGCTIVLPLTRLLCLAWVLLGLRMERPGRSLHTVFRLARVLRPWAMVEVFMLGVFVAYTKLVDLAHVDLGAALYALGALMMVMAAADSALDGDRVWRVLRRRRLVADPAGLVALPQAIARAEREAPRSLSGCIYCGLVQPIGRRSRCACCGARVYRRKPQSQTRCWALLIAGMVMYVPANTLPVLTAVRLARGHPSTILGGVQELLGGGMWPLALLVFFASITVPVLKLIGMTILLVSVRLRSRRFLHDRTVLYRVIEWIGRWSMIDVFMISILVGLVRLGAIASVTPNYGAVAFASVVVMTMLAAASFDPRLMWDAAGQNGRLP